MFNIDEAWEFTRANMYEGLPNADLRTAFALRPIILYVDKIMGNEVEVVQTFSRLN
ncbi:hypothetical protein TAO_0331 [Candidatus Nitrosoglobus terrae]|uniref:Uncharacterized protein n=1 Tax=Candidatus Nitrosoglobus terrae TaxID=1630141 RepID=A0A1Q2SKM4_9GAMM|nr:hypothetical protein TAO_0331 [Candidatus Nitrosoglobus terrae]